MGRPRVARKCRKTVTHGEGHRAFTGLIRARPAAAGQEILLEWTSGRPPPPWPVHVQWWWQKPAPTAET